MQKPIPAVTTEISCSATLIATTLRKKGVLKKAVSLKIQLSTHTWHASEAHTHYTSNPAYRITPIDEKIYQPALVSLVAS